MNKRPTLPKYPLRFLRWFCRDDFIEEIEGDLAEIYAKGFERSPRRAKWNFFWQVLLHFRPDFIKGFKTYDLSTTIDMFLNHLRSAFRQMRKRKQLSLLNLLGLSIGMAACLLILQYIDYEQSYDQFHPDLSRLYRLNLGMTNTGDSTLDIRATNHPAAGLAIKRDFPQVEEIARLVDVKIFFGSAVISYKSEGKQIQSFYEENMYVADPSFFDIFGYPLAAGNPNTALSNPENIVITESMAKKYFANEDPLGKRLFLNGGSERIVTGVLQDLPENSHLKIRALLSTAGFSEGLNNAWIWPEFYTYLKLAPRADANQLEGQLDGFVNKYLGPIMREFGIEEKMYLQPVEAIHLQGNLLREARVNGSHKTISFLVIIALMILLIAWMNYINLTTSRSMERATEVGIRKVVGARKRTIVGQFLVESAVMNALAIALALLLVFFVAPSFNHLVGKPVIAELSLSDAWKQGSIWTMPAMMLIGGTFIAGLYPAIILSSFQPAKTIKGKVFNSGKQFQFRQVLVAFQFAISILMIIGTVIVFKQLYFMRSQDMGFEMEQVLIVKTPSIVDSTFADKSDLFVKRVSLGPHIHHVTASSDIPGHIIQNNNSIKRKGQSTAEAIFATFMATDEGYLSTYKLELLAGRNFSKDMPTDRKAVILNEKAAELLGYHSPETAIGKIVTCKNNGWQDLKVIGVVNNINHRSLAHKQEPFAYFNEPVIPLDYYSLNIRTASLPGTIANIEQAYREIFPANPFEYFFLDDYFAEQYRAEQQFGKIFSIFAGLAIFVACLGLFGLASFIAARRTKETGIRKILGASVGQILLLFGKQFIGLILIAALFAIPLAWWAGNQWLSNYAYRIKLNAWVFIIPVVLVLLIAAVTIVWQSSKTALVNPADVLRHE